jgi:glutathione S-transferase
MPEETSMKLYDMELSGNCYKVRLFLALIGRKYDTVPVNLKAGEQKRPEYLAVNPLGKVPALEDDGNVIRDSQAILVYLGRKYGGPKWWPEDAAGQGEIVQWLSFAANEMWHGCAIARAIPKFNRPGDHAAAQTQARAALAILEGRLSKNDWLALGRPTIADIACYPYAALVWEGGVPIDAYPAVRAWFKRIAALPGYIGMPGIGG